MIFVKRLFVIVIFVSVFGVGISQETDNKPLRPIINSTMLELGRTGRLYDSYLSMIGYAGFNVGLSNERLQMARWGKNKVLSQQMVSLNYASTRNEAQNGKMIMGMLHYAYGMLYTARVPVSGLIIYGGGQAEARAGFIYNLRNSNNPATAKVDLNLSLSGIAAYTFRIKKYPITIRYQMILPFAGMFFGPAFGQSYYEMFEVGNLEGTIHFGSFHNQFHMNNLVTVDLPLGRGALRLGYRNTIYSTLQSHIDTQIYTNSFVVGVTTEFIPWNRRKQARQKQHVFPVYY